MQKLEKEENKEIEEKEKQITYNIDVHDSIMTVKWNFEFKEST